MTVINFIRRKLSGAPHFKITEGTNILSGVKLNNGDLLLKFSVVGYDLVSLTLSRQSVERLRDWMSRTYPRGLADVTELAKTFPVPRTPTDPDGNPPNAG